MQNAQLHSYTVKVFKVYQAARQFRKAFCAVARRLHDSEKFTLVSQIRYATLSPTNNSPQTHGSFHYLVQINSAPQTRSFVQEQIAEFNGCELEHNLPTAKLTNLKQQTWCKCQRPSSYTRDLPDLKMAAATAVLAAFPPYGMTHQKLNAVVTEPIAQFNNSTVQRFTKP